MKSSKRARQYEHIKESAQKQGRSTRRAKQIAGATVNKQRRKAGETKIASKSAGGRSATGARRKTATSKGSASRSRKTSARKTSARTTAAKKKR